MSSTRLSTPKSVNACAGMGGDAREDVDQPGLRIEPFIFAVYAAQRRLPRPQDPPHRVARQMQAPRDLLDRLPLAQMLAPYPTDRLHNQHPPPPASRQSRQTTKPEIGGSILDADDAPQGVNFARRNTARGRTPASRRRGVAGPSPRAFRRRIPAFRTPSVGL